MFTDVLELPATEANVCTNVNALGVRAEMHRNLQDERLRGG